MNQCELRPMMAFGITRPLWIMGNKLNNIQWVKNKTKTCLSFHSWPTVCVCAKFGSNTSTGQALNSLRASISELTITGSNNGLSPGQRQAIIRTNAAILLIGPLGTNFSEILFGIQTFSFKKMHLNMLSAKWHSFCLSLNELKGE